MAASTKKQERFIEEFCVDCNGKQAAIRAGYSEKTAASKASQLRADPEIEEAIKERMTELGMSNAEATMRMAGWGRGSMAHFLRISDNGSVVVDLSTQEAQDHLHLIREVTQETYTEPGESGKQIKRTKIKLHDAKDATKNIMKAHGAFGAKGTEDDPIHTKEMGEIDWSQIPDDKLEKILAGEDPGEVL